MLRFFSRRQRTESLPSSLTTPGYTPGPRAPERPPLPKPERLNRSALTIAAVIMGTMVLAAVVFMQPSRPIPSPGSGQAPTPAVDQGTFLDQAPTEPVQTTSPPSVATDRTADSLRSAAGGIGSPASPRIGPAEYGSSAGIMLSNVARPRDPRVEAYEAALIAPVVASQMTTSTEMGAYPDPMTTSAGAAEARTPPAVAQPVTPSSTQAPAISPSGDDHRQFLADAARTSPTKTAVSVDPAPGPYAIQAGTLIPAVLITEIDSDLPGQVLAQVARDVFDSRSPGTLLVPRGAKLIGAYEDQVGLGQNRLLIAWSRILLPDGRSISLPGLQTKDRAGAGGIADRVDRHTRRAFGTATLLSLIGAGVQLSQPRGAVGFGGYFPSVGQVAAGAVGQQLAEVATQMLRRELDVRPTIRIRQGMPFNVFLNTDLVFSEPYGPDPDPSSR